MFSFFRSLFGVDSAIARERLRILKEKENLDARVAEDLRMSIRRVFPGRDPEEVILEQPEVAKGAFERIKTYYLGNIRERLALLDKLEGM